MDRAEPVDFHGMPAIAWSSGDGARAIATLQGAHVVSWTLPDGQEGLFLSERSPFAAGRAIRGGIPVIFPQFADRGPLSQHGFARTREWRFMGCRDSGQRMSARFALDASDATLAFWPHAFRLELEATIGGRGLEVRLRVVNPARDAFAFTCALHTYLRVDDAAAVQVRGLRGVRYLTRGESATQVEARENVTADEAIDRTYFSPPSRLHVEDGGRLVQLEQAGFTDTVVWNPGREKADAMADMAPGSYRGMLCVEAAAIEPAVELAAGREWIGWQRIEVAS
jgi:glucose-6-phosphate 1-epimerase